jgi:phage terminase large subunit-like protein
VRYWRTDVIVAEKNYGGHMVKHVLETTRPKDLDCRIVMVDSRRGKKLRAEPVVARYEQQRTYHVGEHEANCTTSKTR